jgi:small-conductance mechanosensitive channel
MLLVVCGVASASEASPAPAGAGGSPPSASAAGTATATQAPAAPSLAEIVAALEALDTTEADIGKRLADAAWLESQRTTTDVQEQALAALQRSATEAPRDSIEELFALTDLAATVRSSERALTTAIETLSVNAKALDADLDRLAAYDAQTTQWLQTARVRNAPTDLIARIEAVPKRNENLARDLRAKRDQALEVLSRATRLAARATALRSEIGSRQLRLEAEARGARGQPLWRIDTRSAGVGPLEIARAEISQITDFLVAHSARLAVIAVAAFALAFALVLAARKKLANAESTYHPETPRLFEAPVTGAIILTLLALVWVGPPGGAVAYYNVLFSLMPIPAALLARNIFAHPGSLSLFMLTAAIVSLGLVGPVVDPLLLEGRLLLIAQCVVAAAGLIVDLRRGTLMQPVRWSQVTTRRIAVTAVVLLALAVLAAVAGYVGPARVLRNIVLGAAGLGLLIGVAVHLLYGLLVALSETRVAQQLRVVSHDPASVRRAALTALRALGWIGWLAGMLTMVGLLDQAVQLVGNVVDAKFRIGAATVSTQAIFAGLAVLAGTFVLVKILRLLLDIELLPRLRLEHGVSFAISAVIRYCLITAGLLLAMAAMGIDLTKVTLLAGAIGVGVGLGLQGFVNNFVSGVILFIERPITTGDTVQIGDSAGVVEAIGVRASTIRTSQGAEVIIPNADLISKSVTNWTLNDRKRGVEIDVSVGREAEAETVIRLLQAAAAGIEGISAKPAPHAWLNALGADRTYRLKVWVDDIGRGTEVQGALRIAIATKFADAHVEIK